MRLHEFGIANFHESQAEYALRSVAVNGNVERALQLLKAFDGSLRGEVQKSEKNVLMLGAENREAVTCYLDSLLFAMFARLKSFEGLLHNSYEDGPSKRLAILLRLWVNMLRQGVLITTDLVSSIRYNIGSWY